MEDPDDEWNIEEYSNEGSSSMVGGILNKGLSIGKRILVTGFVLSSAPVVLPPLVVVSALGVAVSVPFGLYLASYACTEKLMSKLLSTPLRYPSLLDYAKVSYDEEISGFRDEEKGMRFNEEMEEEKMMKDTMGRVEMRLELGEEGSKEVEEKMASSDNGEGVAEENEQESTVEIAGESGHTEDSGASRVDDNKLPESTEVIVEEKSEEEKKEPILEESRVEEEKEPLSGAVITLIDGDRREASDPNEAIDLPIEVTAVVVEENRGQKREADTAVEELKMETTGLLEKIRDEGRADKHEEDMPRVEEQGDSKISSHSRELELPPEVRSASDIDKKSKTSGSLEGETGKTTPAENFSGAEQKSTVQSRKGDSSNGLENMDTVHDATKDYKQRPSNLGDRSADASENSVSADIPVSEEASVPLEKDTAANTGKELFSEEKLWERINAMKIIVGYKAEPHATCMEELKALYIFTGVEPPASFNDPADIAEINDKLQFLMSVVGVK